VKAKKSEVTVTNVVAVDPATAFAIFTSDIDVWWRRGKRYRFAAGEGSLRFEDRRLVEIDASGERYELGRVLAWEPAARLAFEWRPRGFAESERTEVEVRFDAVDGGTRVTLEHRGIDALRADHPARYGLDGEAYHSMIALYWGDQINRLRFHIARR
jgi:uncharacterized protein YndB with AHSA1/START domain